MARKSPDNDKSLDAVTRASSKLALDDFMQLLNSPTRIMYLNFRAGFWHGVGFTIGAAFVVVVVGFLVVKLGGLPYIGDLLNQLNNAMR